MKRKYRMFQVDSFTDKKFSGNPAGVVVNADGLTDNEMQQIAKELNNSETAFILSPTESDHDVSIIVGSFISGLVKVALRVLFEIKYLLCRF